MTERELEQAAARVRAGGLVAYPTETVWGLGADATSAPALARLRAFKGRDPAQPLAVLVSGPDGPGRLGIRLDPRARRIAEACWPGPLTLVVPGPGALAPGVAREDGAVGLRCSPHPVAAALAGHLERCGAGPITTTSLNRSGEAPAHTWDEAARVCGATAGGEPPLLLAGDGPDAGGLPASTVLDLCGARPSVLRWGALGPDRLGPLVEGGAPA